jgi:hypothetical protein
VVGVEKRRLILSEFNIKLIKNDKATMTIWQIQHTKPQRKHAWIQRNFYYLQTCFILFYALAGSAQAADTSQQGYAKVWRLSGTVTAEPGATAHPRKLQIGDTVYVGEQIQAEANSEAVFQTADSGYIALRPGGVFLVEQFAANKQDSDNISIRLFQGGLRLLTGWIGKLNPKGYRVATPSATIGIRGTDHEPYVVSNELALSLKQPAGTYDKVNSGATVLEVSSKSVGIEPGRVGFVRLAKPVRDRALLTLLLPVLLEKVPEFFVPGLFDGELDGVSSVVSDGSVRPDVAPEVAQQPVVSGFAPSIPSRLKNGQCNSSAVAKAWLARLDGALAAKNPSVVISLFAADTTIRSVVKINSGGTTALDISREELASSASAMMKSLTDYRQSRISITGSTVRPGHCDVISVRSLAVEQGLRDGKPYRFRSLEEYQLELIGGNWVATKAATTQQ